MPDLASLADFQTGFFLLGLRNDCVPVLPVVLIEDEDDDDENDDENDNEASASHWIYWIWSVVLILYR